MAVPEPLLVSVVLVAAVTSFPTIPSTSAVAPGIVAHEALPLASDLRYIPLLVVDGIWNVVAMRPLLNVCAPVQVLGLAVFKENAFPARDNPVPAVYVAETGRVAHDAFPVASEVSHLLTPAPVVSFRFAVVVVSVMPILPKTVTEAGVVAVPN